LAFAAEHVEEFRHELAVLKLQGITEGVHAHTPRRIACATQLLASSQTGVLSPAVLTNGSTQVMHSNTNQHEETIHFAEGIHRKPGLLASFGSAVMKSSEEVLVKFLGQHKGTNQKAPYSHHHSLCRAHLSPF
jgi:hypothetical protein